MAVPDFKDYKPLSLDSVAKRLATYPGVQERLGGKPESWTVREVGDGNLNFVYIVTGPDGSLCAKQALPYVRLVGESWPLPLSRSFYEHAALVRQDKANGSVPEIFNYDGPQALIVMENLSPHVIWRKALINREQHDVAAKMVGEFAAECHFRTSDLALSAETKKAEIAMFAGNTALCKITEDLVFTDPYYDHPMNSWTSPELDETVRAVQGDPQWKAAVQELKFIFLTRTEAMLHGDLHTGSIMVHKNEDGTEDIRIIDPEFAFYGPMGFDCGALIGNLLLNLFAQDGYPGRACVYQDWLLEQIENFCHAYASRFSELWRTERTGDAYARSLFEDQNHTDASEIALTNFLHRVEMDSLGFAGAKMTRRIIGLAGVADLQGIADPATRAACERRALALARMMVVERVELGSLGRTLEHAERILKDVK
ncbi:S-methyl-5-thioribose kinase [Acuticoccus sp. MNP-M23]|uniref:S-methyl-5-thioribose kinase n=1 Tax=Acuticoccus sp. MNP-M23 TaxID=3072793 RepID=UPI0028158CF9|nr:S-methyl-5-thioribose kinase [Acuticoccus sp. MNP-M23]WMS43632.1 S-methyl-5-thioribose kinase [Acuticoccus sp. MNP-M23]